MKMKKTATALALAAAVAAPVAIAGPAHAIDPEHWASHREFNDVRAGWTLAKVNDHFDTRGRFADQSGNQLTRIYRGWNRNITVGVTYKRSHGRWVVGWNSWQGVTKWASYSTGAGYDDN